MRKKNLKPMIISALLAIGFGASTVGTSFALFTDKADTSISVTSGLVEVESVAKLIRYHSSIDNAEHEFGATETSYTNDKVGTTFGLSGHTISIDKMVPGDELTFSLKAINKSNVRTKTRYTLAHALLGEKADLFPALEIEYAMEEGSSITEVQKGQIFRWKANEAVVEADLEEGIVLHTILVTVKFPNDDNEIRAREEGENNKYQDAACSITFGLEAVQANANTDPIAEINEYLRAKQMLEGANPTMHDAVLDMGELGYTLKDFVGFGAYVWSVETDQFVAESQVTANQNKYFKVYDNMPATSAYSVYARNNVVDNVSSWTTASVAVDGVGFDAGDVANIITKVRYTNTSGSAKANIIRTNSLDTEVEIDAATDVVKHYGDAKKVTIEAVAGSSYHEYGRVAVVDIANGRIALEETAEVTQMHFTATQDAFNDITVSYDEAVTLPKFSRDAITTIQDGGTLVVALQAGTEEITEETKLDYIWLYQQGLVQQMRVSESADSAGNVKATDTGVSTDTHQVAEDIANAIKPEAASSYEPEQIDAGNVDSEDVVEQGIAAEDKAEYIDNVVEESVSEYIIDADENYKVRIGARGYYSFDAAYEVVKTGETMRILEDCSATGQYNLTGKTISLFIEEGKTLSFGSVANEKIRIGEGGVISTLTLEGDGNITFVGNSNYSLVTQYNSSTATKVIVKDVHIQALNSLGTISSNLEIESGTFDNIRFIQKPFFINGGLFDFDFTDYLPDGKMAVKVDTKYYSIGALTPDRANFVVTTANSETYYFRTLSKAVKSAGANDLVEAINPNVTYEINDQDDNIDEVTSGVTIDLKGGTLEVADAHYAFYTSIGTEVTLKNATINAKKLVTTSASQGITLTPINVMFKDGMTAVEESIASGFDYFKNTESQYFTYVSEEPSQYKVKVTRNSRDCYYDGEAVESSVLTDIQDNDRFFINANLLNDIVVPIGKTITVAWDEGVNEPNVVKDPDADELVVTTISENEKVYFAKSLVVAQVFDSDNNLLGAYKNMPEAMQSLENSDGYTLKLVDDVDLNGVTLTITKTTGNTNYPPSVDADFDLNGKTLSSNNLMFSLQISGFGFRFVDSSENKTGKVICTAAGKSILRAAKKSTKVDSGYIEFNGGTFITNETEAIISHMNYTSSDIGKWSNRINVRTVFDTGSAAFLKWGESATNIQTAKTIRLYARAEVNPGTLSVSVYSTYNYNTGISYTGTKTVLENGYIRIS